MKPGIAVYGVEVETYAADGAAPRRPRRCRSAARRSPRASPCATSARCRSKSSAAASPTCWSCRNTPSRKRSACWSKAPRRWPRAPARPAIAALLTYPEQFRGKKVGVADHRRQHRRAHPVQRAAAQPAARRAAAAAASADPRPARRAGGHRRQDRRHRAATSSRSRTSGCSPSSSVQAAELEVMVEARDPRMQRRSSRRWNEPTSFGGCDSR